ncbi:hypothetical protein C8R46DRAFT_1087824 [Mycena filopes]|nr:hypothetical protein C8R46DRAFT_1087824 [Mycena filopes]
MGALWSLPSILSRGLHRFVILLKGPSPSPPLILTTLPTDVLHVIFEILYNTRDPAVLHDGYGEWRFHHEKCIGARLLALSQTSRFMRAETMPWVYREVYNWSRPEGDVWPKTLWPFFRVLHIRDHSVRHPKHLPLGNALFTALPMMSALTQVTLRLDSPLPPGLLGGLAMVPNLTSLEILQIRFDGPSPPVLLPFVSLSSLRLTITGFKGVVRADGINHGTETYNVGILLRNVAGHLKDLKISGDLLSPEFLAISWPSLKTLCVTEHTPTPFLAVPHIVAGMRALGDFSILFSADLTRDADDTYPPFTLGVVGGDVLTRHSPHLTSVTLSNLVPTDPIFAQLPSSLEALHLLAMLDLYVPGPSSPPSLRGAPLTHSEVLKVLDSISHLTDLHQLTITTKEFPTPDLIHEIASKFPALNFLQLALPRHRRGDRKCLDVRNDAFLPALQRLPLLAHLRISLDFESQRFDEAKQVDAASWLMQALPNLQIVEFSWPKIGPWEKIGLEDFYWAGSDRSVLLLPPRRSPIPSPPRSRRPSFVISLDEF